MKKREIKKAPVIPALFEVVIEDKDEVKATKFLSGLQQKGFIGKNKIYLENYINADMAIAFAHIKQNYKKYVCEGGWSEEKFEDIIIIIAKNRRMLIPSVFLDYGAKYDTGKLSREIAMEKLKYEKKPTTAKDEDEELLEYIKNNSL
jgi:hypothetical protein